MRNEEMSRPDFWATSRMRAEGPTRIGAISPTRAASIAPRSEDSSQGCTTAVGVGGIALQRAISRSYFSWAASIPRSIRRHEPGPNPRAIGSDVLGRVRRHPASVDPGRHPMTHVLADLGVDQPVQLGIHLLQEGGMAAAIEREVLDLMRVALEVEQLDVMRTANRASSDDCARSAPTSADSDGHRRLRSATCPEVRRQPAEIRIRK